MMELQQSSKTARIFVVLVLYKESPAESQALQALMQALAADPTLAQNFSVLLYDNSPAPQELPEASVPLQYVHDPSNRGLAVAYNYALARANTLQLEWLLLLDQDTGVTREYLAEAVQLTTTCAGESRIAAFAPHLYGVKGLSSPHLIFVDMVRRQISFRNRRPLVAPDSTFGLQEDRWSAFNSGAVLRVSTINEIGGFPEEFWLDFLDIAVFHLLYDRGYRLYIMRSRLSHSLSMDADNYYEKESSLGRRSNMLQAMSLYMYRHGTLLDRLLNRGWLLRMGLSQFRNIADKRFAAECFRRAIFFRSGP